MATDNKNDDFEQSFNEGPPAAAEVSEDQAFGITPPEDGGSSETGEPAAVVIVADEVVAGEGGDAASDEAAAAEAKAVTDENNAKASASAGAESTATQEAAGSGAAQPAGEAQETVAAAPEDAAAQVDAAPGEESLDLDDMSDVPAEDVQKFKSWQGRLKKIEAQLKAKADAGDLPNRDTPEEGAIAEVVEQADATGNTELADAAQEVAAQVEAGEISSDEAIKLLTEDFGETFVKMIEAIARATAGKTADEKIGGVSKNVEDVISHITNQSERAHFEAIYDAHPDFVEINKDPAFNEFVAAKGAQATVESGSAKAINALLAEFKASGDVDSGDTANGEPVADAAPVADPVVAEEVSPAQDAVAAAEEAVDDGSDDAEGVRSAGLRLPAEPKAGSDDFAAAWDEFA